MTSFDRKKSFWQGKKVFITGHTGFKGSWLSLILTQLGSQVSGYALSPPTKPSLFELSEIEDVMDSRIGDVADLKTIQTSITRARPQVLFHLAAQPIVSEGYQCPRGTFTTNVMGVVNVLETARNCQDLRAVVNVTTDKCYENDQSMKITLQEDDKLGGRDPYSASKACSEIITAAYRQSFFNHADSVAVATARGGNVIGGGDWGKDRLLPDLFRAVENREPFTVRNPGAVRPWQHVLDALDGYLTLAEMLYQNGHEFAGAWNIGPDTADFKPVRFLVDRVTDRWPMPIECDFAGSSSDFHEAAYLALDCSKANKLLNWKPTWDTEQAIDATVSWFIDFKNGASARELCTRQISAFFG